MMYLNRDYDNLYQKIAQKFCIVEMVCGKGRQYSGFTVQYDAAAD